MSKKKFAIIFGAIVIAAVAAAVIWYFFGDGRHDSKDRVYVEKVSVIMGTATGAQNRYSGVVQPQKSVEINADSERTVKEVLVKVGDTVEEGTPLFNYDTDDLNMDLSQAKLELENQDIEISNYKTQISELEKEKKDAAEADKFEYTTQIQSIETQIKQAEFEKSSKQLEMDKIQKKIDSSQVTSTAAGVIKSINDGQSQDTGDTSSSSAFMTILSTGEYRIQGTINEQNVGMISAGEDVIVRSRVDENVTWKGTIDKIETGEPSSSSDSGDMGDSSEDSSTVSSKYPFYVTLENADGLMLGQHVLIELDNGQMEEKEGVWLYSSYIVMEDGETAAGMENLMEGTESTFEDLAEDTETYGMEDLTEGTETGTTQNAFVWADNGNGRLEKRAVTLGAYDADLDEYEILSGLTEDDLIAWPMEGLYEGIITVTDMDEVDYSSDLYNQDGDTEAMWDDSEYMWDDTEYMWDTEGMMDEGMMSDTIPDTREAGVEDLSGAEVSE